MNNFYTEDELKAIGFKKVGKRVLISRKVSIYNPSVISIGNNVRIDDFCILSGEITLGNHIHIAAHNSLYAGDAGIIMEDFSGISSRSVVYAVTDDYSGEYLTNPMISEKFRNVIKGEVIIKRHVLIGAGSIVLPGVTLEEGSCFGAMSLITRDARAWSVNVGIPAVYKKDRSKEMLKLENDFIREYGEQFE